MPGESYRRWLWSLLLHLCYVFWALINTLECWFNPATSAGTWRSTECGKGDCITSCFFLNMILNADCITLCFFCFFTWFWMLTASLNLFIFKHDSECWLHRITLCCCFYMILNTDCITLCCFVFYMILNADCITLCFVCLFLFHMILKAEPQL